MRRPNTGHGRRDGFRGVGSDAEGGVPWVALSGFLDLTNYYGKTGALWPTTPLTCGAIVHIDDVPAGNNAIVDRFGTTGAELKTNATSLLFGVIDGGGTGRTSPAITIAAGKTYAGGWSHDGTTVRAFQESGEVGSGTAASGYTVPTLDDRVGVRPTNATDGSNVRLVGFAVGDSILTAAQWTQWIRDCKAAKRILALPAGMVAGWDVRTGMVLGGAPATWAPFSGSGAWTITGALTAAVVGVDFGN